MRKIYLLLTIALICLFILGLFFAVGRKGFLNSDKRRTNVEINGALIEAEVAEKNYKKAKGLSERKRMTEDEGMLFVYKKPSRPKVWMKNMNFSIDIIWIDDKKKVAGFEKNISPDTYPKKFQPQEKVNYFLEVKVGFCRKNNIKKGDRVKFEI